ncbi:MAG TPA: AAA family ATPase [Kineosporiaceae bacterium]|nr:AAA family ATPase [Kineosporiaceae bacterium]
MAQPRHPGGPGAPPDQGSGDYVVLHESARTRVVRLRSRREAADRAGVIWKEPLGPAAVQRQQHELEILQRLAHVPGVPRVVQASGGGSGFALRDDGGRPLSAVLADPPRDGRGVTDRHQLVDMVAMLARLAAVLVDVHAAGVIHEDVNPANILLRPPDDAPVLIDWDLATTFLEELPAFTHVNQIAGTLAYLAPEQTGRTGYGIDPRTDLYGLGATAYECCTGAPPFGDRDPLSLVHDHLARVPVRVDTVNPLVPPALAAVVARLLEKDPDRRYQSAAGLLHDLRRILDELRAGGDPDFAPGQRDVPRRLGGPSRLAGREREIGCLQDAFEESLRSSGGLLLVSGPAGVGKTSLAEELRPAVTARGGWFVRGKFDQYRQDGTGDAVVQAMEHLARLLLAEPETLLRTLRERVLPRLGDDVRLLVGMVPGLAAVLGVSGSEEPGDRETDPRKFSARLLRAARHLVQAVASPDRPVVMFLDDLQWAGDLPVSFLDAMVTAGALPGFLLIAAYRDGDIDAGHPLQGMFGRWNRLGREPRTLALGDLPAPAVRVLLAEMLGLDPATPRTAELAEAFDGRTHGNPLEVVELVNELHREGLLDAGESGWTWDTAAVTRYVAAVGDRTRMLASRIEALPAASATVIDVLACLGGEVRLELLEQLCDLGPTVLTDALQPCLSAGLLVAVQDGPAAVAVRFRHDRVREGAYTRLSPDARRRRHLDLARQLYAHPDTRARAAEHYLAASTQVSSPQERVRVASLLGSTATTIRLVNQVSAERFVTAARGLVAGLETPAARALTTRLMVEHHAALFNLARFDDADALYHELEQRGLEPVALAAAAGVQVVSLNHRGRPAEAVALAVALLSEIGFPPPAQEELDAVNRAGLATLDAWVAAGPQPGELDRPEVSDPRIRAAAVLIERAVPAAWYVNHPLMPWLMFLTHRLWVEYGPCPSLLSCFGGVGMTGVNLRGDYGLGYAVNRRVLAVGQARDWEPDTSQLLNTHSNFDTPYFEPIEQVIEEALTARERLLRCGELQYASYTYVGTLWAAIDCTPTLDAVQAELASAMTFWSHTGYQPKVLQYTGYQQLLRCLRGDTDLPGEFTGPGFDDEEYLRELGPDQVSVFFYHLVKGLAAAVFDRFDQAYGHARTAMAMPDAAPGMYLWTTVRLVLAVACQERARTAGDTEAAELDTVSEEQARWLAGRAADAPDNYGHLAAWLQAERAWTRGRFEEAAVAFDRAMTQAGRRRPWHAALITERAGRLHLAHGRRGFALALLAQACDLYAEWGADAKVGLLTEEFPGLRPADRPAGAGNGSLGGRGGGSGRDGDSLQRGSTTSLGHARRSTSSTRVSSHAIDLMAVLQASQALSGETNLDQLRRRVVEVLGAMTGATAVRLALWNEDAGRWFVAVDDLSATELCVDDEAAAKLVCRSALRYAERTGEPLLVPDATRDDRFRSDPYLDGLAGCSLLVLPIVLRGRPRAMLLLENRLSLGMFTQDRLDAVRLVAGQLAASLDNALAERFRSLVQRSSELTLVCDRTARVTYASEAATRMLGTAGGRLLGSCVLDLVHADDRTLLRDWLGSAPPGQVLECRVTADQEGQRWVEIAATDLTADPAVAGLVLHLRDVTDRRRLEAELRQAHKLESMGQLAAGVAHEINTPVQFIANNLQFIAEGLAAFNRLLAGYRQALGGGVAGGILHDLENELDADFLSTELPLAAQQAIDGARTVARIIRAMKAFSHPGKEDMSPADLNDAVRNALVMATNEIEHVADVVLELSELPPVRCRIDDVNQALLNLIVNAAQAMAEVRAAGGPRGTLTLRSRVVGDQAEIQVSDTGTGIPPEIAERVFDQFFTTKPVGVGTGQGLSLAYTLIRDRHHGSLTFRSEPGAGTTFTLRLPISPPTGEPTATADRGTGP